MSFVDNSPTNLTEIEIASNRLYGNNRYMCVPNFEKTSLVEFCFDGTMGIQKKSKKFETESQSKIFFF